MGKYVTCLIGFIILMGVVFSGVDAADTPEAGYTLSLKELAEKARENIKKVDQELAKQETERQNQEREAHARQFFEEANALYAQGDIEGARELWQKALDITQDPQMSGYIKESERKAKEEDRARAEEERRLERERWAQEREKALLEREAKRKAEQEAREKARQEELARKEEVRKAREEQARLEKQRQEEERIRKAKEEEDQRQLNQQAKAIYDDASELYRAKDHTAAQEKFQEAANIVPDYSRTAYYLKRIPADIEQARIDSFLDKANTLYQEEQYTQAEGVYKQVLELEPQNRTALRYIELIPQKIREEEKEQLRLRAEPVYEDARSLYNQKQYSQALEKFKETEGILPGYKKTQYYLECIPQDIQREEEYLAAEQERQEELAKKEKERQAREEKARLEREQKEKARLEAKAKHKEELVKKKQECQAKLEAEKKARQEQRVREVAEREKARLEQERQRQLELEKREEEKRLEAEKREKIRNFNKEAKSLYRDENYNEASAKFQEVLALDPENQSALRYLERIPQKIKEGRAKEK